VVPIVAALSSVLFYAQNQWLFIPFHTVPVLAGTSAALLLWFAAAFAFRPFTSADRANARSLGELLGRVEQLYARLASARQRAAEHRYPPAMEAAQHEVEVQYQAIRRELARGGPQWIMGSGYVYLWSRMHRAEEAWITAAPDVQEVVGAALWDELRIQGSSIENRSRLLGMLRQALRSLSQSAGMDVGEVPRGRSADANGTAAVGTSLAAAGELAGAPAAPVAIIVSPPAGSQPAALGESESRPAGADALEASATLSRSGAEAEARTVLRQVRSALHEYRDDRWNKLVRARNRILGTITLTGVVTYALLAFILNVRSAGSPQDPMRDPVIAAAGFYLVGAIVGLFDRLYSDSRGDMAEEDYGLASARLLLTPILSGLSAIGGVLITGMLIGSVNVDVLVPRGAAGPNGTPLAPVTPMPGQIFNLAEYPFGLFLAALFGLTPKLLLDRLKQEGQRYKAELSSTRAQVVRTTPRTEDEELTATPAAGSR
jgi:hypothetical protein